MAIAFAFLVLLSMSPAAYAATTHTVGGTSGWTTGVDYGSWASGQNFAVGDTLAFNYDAMTHAVYEVNQDQFNNCHHGDGDDDDANPINVFSTSPTNIVLSAPGTRYFVCPRSNHCALGVKLVVTIGGGSAAPAGGAPPPTTTPSPTPVTPATPATPVTPAIPETPATVPVTPAVPGTPAKPVTPAVPGTPAKPVTPSAPPPPRNCTTHVVGGDSGWTTGVNYENWVKGQNFTVCDALLFNFDTVTHAVYEVSQQDYNNCSTGAGDDDDDDDNDNHRGNPIGVYTSNPTRIPLSTVGTRYFICPRSNNCRQGQKLAVTVVMATNTTAPPSRTNGTAPSGTNGTTIPGNTPPAPGPLSAPPPPFGGATSIIGGGVMGGLSIALAAIVGLMV